MSEPINEDTVADFQPILDEAVLKANIDNLMECLEKFSKFKSHLGAFLRKRSTTGKEETAAKLGEQGKDSTELILKYAAQEIDSLLKHTEADSGASIELITKRLVEVKKILEKQSLKLEKISEGKKHDEEVKKERPHSEKYKISAKDEKTVEALKLENEHLELLVDSLRAEKRDLKNKVNILESSLPPTSDLSTGSRPRRGYKRKEPPSPKKAPAEAPEVSNESAERSKKKGKAAEENVDKPLPKTTKGIPEQALESQRDVQKLEEENRELSKQLHDALRELREKTVMLNQVLCVQSEETGSVGDVAAMSTDPIKKRKTVQSKSKQESQVPFSKHKDGSKGQSKQKEKSRQDLSQVEQLSAGSTSPEDMKDTREEIGLVQQIHYENVKGAEKAWEESFVTNARTSSVEENERVLRRKKKTASIEKFTPSMPLPATAESIDDVLSYDMQRPHKTESGRELLPDKALGKKSKASDEKKNKFTRRRSIKEYTRSDENKEMDDDMELAEGSTTVISSELMEKTHRKKSPDQFVLPKSQQKELHVLIQAKDQNEFSGFTSTEIQEESCPPVSIEYQEMDKLPVPTKIQAAFAPSPFPGIQASYAPSGSPKFPVIVIPAASTESQLMHEPGVSSEMHTFSPGYAQEYQAMSAPHASYVIQPTFVPGTSHDIQATSAPGASHEAHTFAPGSFQEYQAMAAAGASYGIQPMFVPGAPHGIQPMFVPDASQEMHTFAPGFSQEYQSISVPGASHEIQSKIVPGDSAKMHVFEPGSSQEYQAMSALDVFHWIQSMFMPGASQATSAEGASHEKNTAFPPGFLQEIQTMIAAGVSPKNLATLGAQQFSAPGFPPATVIPVKTSAEKAVQVDLSRYGTRVKESPFIGPRILNREHKPMGTTEDLSRKTFVLPNSIQDIGQDLVITPAISYNFHSVPQLTPKKHSREQTVRDETQDKTDHLEPIKGKCK
nr:PREDICTED: uncharacterized protein LOC106701913 [Latimeria chalumnae]|eukprot:XP_014339391.1 PREDICTED: uncharacterized protein LOC106701913 [Latimeria chalumnae]